MFKLIIWTLQFCLFFIVVKGTISQTKLENVDKYAEDVLEMLKSDLEYKGYHNLRMDDLNFTINETMYGDEVVGNLRFFNGFVLAADDVHIGSNLAMHSISQITFEAHVSVTIGFKGLRYAYDMEATLGAGFQRAIGIFKIDQIDYQINMIKNLKTGIFNSSVSILRANMKGRIAFQPKNYYTTVIARKFNGMLAYNDLERFGKEFLGDLLHDIVSERINFPVVNYDTNGK